MDMNKLTKKGLADLVDEVAQTLTDVLAKAEAEGTAGTPLAKASPGQEAPAEKVPAGSSASDSAEESSSADAGDGSESAPPAPDASASPAPDASASPAPDASAPPADAPAGDPADPAAGGDAGNTVEGLQAEYAALPIDQQKMHLLALKAAIMATMASAGDASASPAPDAGGAPAPDASASPAPDASASPAPDASAPPPFAKSEGQEVSRIVAENADLKKSLKERDEALASVALLTDALKSMHDRMNGRRLSVATASAVVKTSTDLKKTEDVDVTSFTPAQINQKLCEVLKRSDIKKSDRDLVDKYVAGSGKKDVSTIAHLLKE